MCLEKPSALSVLLLFLPPYSLLWLIDLFYNAAAVTLGERYNFSSVMQEYHSQRQVVPLSRLQRRRFVVHSQPSPQSRVTIKSRKDVITDYLAEIFRIITVHGFVHFTYIRRHPLEHVVWGLFLLMAVCGTVFLCYTSWNNYWLHPTVIALESNYREWNTTFPATFICPVPIKYDEQQVNATAHRLAQEANTDNVLRLNNFLRILSNLTYTNLHTLKEFQGDPIIPKGSFWKLFNETKFKFSYSNGPKLYELMTEVGMCYAHNSIVARSAKDDSDFIKGSFLNTGRTLLYDYLNSAVNVYFKNPWDIPIHGDQLEHNDEFFYMVFRLKTLSMYATKEVRNLNVHHRKCRFSDEAEDIAISNVYTRNICYSQCRVNLAMELCGCIPFFYPKAINEGKYKECDIDGLLCLEKHHDELTSVGINTGKKHSCSCYPVCEEMNFIHEIASCVPWEKIFGGTRVEWSILEYPTLRLKTDILISFTDVLVSFGGSAGLFLGCSVLSLIEIVYFFTLRFFLYLYKKWH